MTLKIIHAKLDFSRENLLRMLLHPGQKMVAETYSRLTQILLGPDQIRQTCLLTFSEKDAREGILYFSSRMGFSTAASNWSIDLITKRLFDWIGTLNVTYLL